MSNNRVIHNEITCLFDSDIWGPTTQSGLVFSSKLKIFAVKLLAALTKDKGSISPDIIIASGWYMAVLFRIFESWLTQNSQNNSELLKWLICFHLISFNLSFILWNNIFVIYVNCEIPTYNILSFINSGLIFYFAWLWNINNWRHTYLFLMFAFE